MSLCLILLLYLILGYQNGQVKAVDKPEINAICNTTNNSASLLIPSPESNMTDPDLRQVLYILVTGPYPHPFNTGWDQGISLIPAVRLAFREINKRKDILKDYRLEMFEDNSGCREIVSVATIGINSFVESVYYTYAEKKIISIIGPGCSDTALALAPILSRDHISLIQISPTATSPAIEIRNYSTTFTMVSSSLAYINSFVALMNHSGWTRVATLFDELGGNFRATHQKFVEKLNNISEYSITYTSHIYDDKDVIYLPLTELKRTQARIVLVFAGKRTVQKILCLAYHFNMTYPQYQWVFSERNLKDYKCSVSFEYHGNSYTCKEQEMAVASNGSILNKYSLIQEDGDLISVTNNTYSLYREQYNQEFKKHFCEQKTQDILTKFLKSDTNCKKSREHYSEPTGSWENTYYDAAWAIGLALDKLSKTGFNLSHYRLGQPDVTKNLTDELLRVEFKGATGPVQFSSESRSVQTRIIITQLFIGSDNTSELTETQVAMYYHNLTVSTNNVFFIEDTYNEIPIRVHYALGIIIITFTVAVTILTVFLQIIFIVWHYKRSMKASSPNINHLVFSGCYLFLLATILYVIQQSFLPEIQYLNQKVVYAIFCNTITWCLLLGFSLIFGTVFVKVWRIFRLFKHFRNESPGLFLSDNALIIIVIFFLSLDVFICLLWNVIDPWILKKKTPTVLEKDDPVFVYYSCSCDNMLFWIGLVTAYKGTIGILLVVFSTLNRKIQRKDFSHTKSINILVYGITMLGSVGYPLYFLLNSVNNVSTGIYPRFVIFCCILLVTVCLCCFNLFLLPVVPVLRELMEVMEFKSVKQTRDDK